MKKKFNKNILLLLIPIISIIIYCFDLKSKHAAYFKEYFIFAISISIIMVALIYILKKKDVNLEKSFLIVGLVLGLIYIFSSPLFTGSDEHNHYYRIYEISEGTLVTPTDGGIIGSKLPESLSKTLSVNNKYSGYYNTSIKYSDIKDMIKIKLNKKKIIQHGYGFKTLYANTALYSFVPYIPQAIGFSIGKLLNSSPYCIGVIGRIFNLLTYLAICYFGIKKMPKNKLAFMILLLSPSLFSTACTLSADTLTNSVIFLFIATIMDIYYRKKNMNRKEMVLLFTLSIIIGASKIVYLPITFLLFLIPNDKFSSKKMKYFYCIGITLLSTIINLIWLKFTDPYMNLIYTRTKLQEELILKAPFNYIKVLFTTFIKEFLHLTSSAFAGTDMYHSQILVNPIVSAVLLVLFILVLLNNENKKKINTVSKVFIFVVMVTVSVLVCTAIYVQFDANFVALNNSYVKGLQGRYFIPAIMMIPLIVNKKMYKFDEKTILYILTLLHIPVYLIMFIRFIA